MARTNPLWPWRHALVTGASSGIGEAMVRALAAAGIATVAVARRADRLALLAARWPGLVEPLTADLETAGGRQTVARRIATEATAPFDLVVNNAGFGLDGAYASRPAAEHLAQVNLNVVALLEITTAALDVMVPAGRGTIVQVSSVAGFQPAPFAAVYAATKAFVTSHTEALAEELRGSGVTVTALCPGYTRTEFHQRSSGSAPTSVPSWAWHTSERVALAGLHGAAQGKVLVVPGVPYRAIASLSSVIPRRIVRRVAGALQRQDERSGGFLRGEVLVRDPDWWAPDDALADDFDS